MDLLQQLQSAVGDTYRVERELGAGGMSRLFLAHEPSLDREIVLKVLPPDFADAVTAERFRREVLLIAKLQHPHIVPILGAGTASGLTWYAMPFVTGESLRQLLQREGPMPVDRAADLIAEVADALAFAHRHGVVHRDIKPENILLADGHAVIADFGIAQAASVAHGDSGAGRLTGTGIWVGTLGYMSPEQIAADSALDGRSDVYSLAVVGYELLTGRTPFQGETGAHVLAAQMRDAPPGPTTLRAGIDIRVSDAILRALARDPADRFQTAAEFRQALLPAQRGSARVERRVIVAGLAAAAALAVAAKLVVSRFAVESAAPAADAIAIAPFNILDPGLALWKEGLVDVLARSLDGMGPIRTVGAATSIQRWAGHADATSAATFGREVRARYVLFGVLQPSGSAEALVRATLLEVDGARLVGDIEYRDSVVRMDRVADTLSVRVVRLLSGDRRLALSPRATLIGSRSLIAIKDFLQGEQLHRAGLFDSAAVLFRHAIALDSTFALAYWGLANSRGWSATRNPDDRRAYLRAGALNTGLGPRDSMLVLHDSIQAWITDSPDLDSTVRVAAHARSLALLRTITTRYPEDPVGWYRFSETIFHGFNLTREPYSLAQIADAVDRAIVADSGNTEAHVHALQTANTMGNRERVLAYARGLARHTGDPATAAQGRFLEWFVGASHTDEDFRRFADTVSDSAWYAALSLLLGMRITDSTAAAPRLLRALSRSGRQWPRVPPATRLADLAAQSFEYHGQLAAARALTPAPVPNAAAALAQLGILDAGEVARMLAAVPRDSLAMRMRLVPFWAWRRDTSSILAVRGDLIARGPPTSTRNARGRAFTVRVVDGFLALARADTLASIAILEPLPYTVPGDFIWLSWHSEAAPMLARRDRHADALRFAEFPIAALNFGVNTAADAERLLIAARIAERAGERERAQGYYAQLDKAWAHADPQFEPLKTDVRAALERLRADRPVATPVPVKR